MKRPTLLLLLSCSVACGMSEERFLVDGVNELCEQAAACTGTFEPSACVDFVRSDHRTSCDYDPRAARSCYRTLSAPACVNDGDLQTHTFPIPEVCQEVWPGCPIELEY